MVQPLLKWVGNKRKVAKDIISFFPDQFNNYIEPFVGSGAVLAELQDMRVNSFFPSFSRAFASDNNEYLIQIFNYVKDDPQTIIDYYRKNILNFSENKKENYTIIRNRFNAHPNGLDFCLLSRTCYGGIIRFRKNDGYMSTPVGPHNPISPDSFEKRVHIWHELLKDVQFTMNDFKDEISKAGKGDVVYCDPPYTHSQGILYGAQDFLIDDLWDAIGDAKNRGAMIFLSINGSRESRKKDISIKAPEGLFEREIDIDVGISMVDRLQKNGKKMDNAEVFDKLMITF